MWIMLGASFLVLALLLYLPGYLFLRMFSIERTISIAAAPLIAASVYSLEAILFAKAGIFANWASITLPLVAVAAIGYAIRMVVNCGHKIGTLTFGLEQKAAHLALFAGAGIIAAALFYLLPLGSADAFICGNDIVHHLSLNRSFLESGNWSTLESTTTPGVGGAFYPSLWSLLAVLPMSAIGTSSVIAAHVVNALIVALVYPLSLYLLAARLFEGRPLAICMTALLAFAFFGFPWEMFLRKTLLYPNALGFALMPGFLGCFMLCFQKGLEPGERTRIIALAFAGLCAICLAHPNTLFTAAIFCYAFLVHIGTSRSNGLGKKAIAIAAITIAFAAAWVGLSFAPFMHSVVSNPYNAGTSRFLIGGIARIAVLKSPHLGTQALLALLVAIGFFSLFRKGERHWIALPFFIMALLYALNVSLDPGTMKSILTGFWYNHPTRVFASAALYAIPLAALGARFVILLACKAAQRARMHAGRVSGDLAGSTFAKPSPPDRDCEPDSPAAKAALAAALAIAVYALPLPLPGAMTPVDLIDEMKGFYDPNGETSFFTQEERDFMKKVSQSVPQSSCVLNMPNDGSAFAYALYGVNVSGRDFYNSDTCGSVLGAAVAAKLGTDANAAQQLKDMGYDYVLVLDSPSEKGRTIYNNRYDEEQWAGMLKLNASTPDLTPVLESDGMTLYEITPSKAA